MRAAIPSPIPLLTLVLALPAAAAAEAPLDELRAAWARDWNIRIDANTVLKQHPCGDYAFDPWAYSFLAACEPGGRVAASEAECEARTDWVWARSRQCNTWQTWLLRNHGAGSRSAAQEPETRVE